MIAIDTSVIVALVLAEAEAKTFTDRLEAATHVLLGTPTEMEARMVLIGRLGIGAVERIDFITSHRQFVRVDFTAAHLAAATDAFLRYGKGRHPAGLNYGDCLAYAVASVGGCPLLYKGEDFARTDIRPAL